MKFLDDWNFWLSIITVVVAVVALCQTKQQIRISNKQSLFDRRINNYVLVVELIQTYENYCKFSSSDKNGHPPLLFHNELNLLTSTFFLFPMRAELAEPTQKSAYDTKAKFNELYIMAETVTLIFSDDEAKIAGEFVRNYRELLIKIFDYQNLDERLNRHHNVGAHCEGEEDIKNELTAEINVARENLRKSYEKTNENNVMEKLRNQIKL